MAEPTRVLISYSHDTPAHTAAVLALADDLRRHGIDAWIDQYDPFPKVGWPAWMREKLGWANKIIAVCTPTYRERFEQHNPAGVGLGASWEGLLAELTIYGDRDRRGDFVPVLLAGASSDAIPTLLRGLTFHALPDAAPTDSLLRHLVDAPAAPLPPLGPLQTFAARSPGLPAAPSVEDRADALNHAIAHAHAAGDTDRLTALRAELRDLQNARRRPRDGELTSGTVLAARYHLSRKLGHGGIAAVWAASETLPFGRVRQVAVKVVHPHHLEDRSVLDRIRKGCADHAQLDDHGVVRVHAPWVEADDRCFVVMDLLTGGDLDQATLQHGLTPLDAVRLCLEVGYTLARLHAKELIHADVKPANILLDGEGRPRLSDFDLAKNLALSMVGTTRRLGDPQFSCQEQQDGEEVTPAWDVFGLSVTALWCASGGTLTKKAWRKGNYPPLPLPGAVMAVLRRGAATDPDDRIADMATWCRDLKAALTKGADAKPPPPTPPTQAPTAAPPPPSKAPPRPTPPDDLGRRLAATAVAPPADPTNPATLIPGARRTLLLPGGVPLHLAWIPAGTFWMGSPDGLGDADERPRHQVTLTRPYWLGVTPVTQAQWAALAATAKLNQSPSHFKGADRPVEQVSWDDARVWCNALSACLGLPPAYPDLTDPDTIEWTAGARLPTEAEWERACRAATDTAFSFGDDPAALAEHGWFNVNSDGETHPVASKGPNPWGLHDVHGNVWEWCWDGWLRHYTAQPVNDPRLPPSTSGYRCVRGGSFVLSAGWCRSAYRYSRVPTRRVQYQGLRVVVAAPADALTFAS